jgi:hypothetical protein
MQEDAGSIPISSIAECSARNPWRDCSGLRKDPAKVSPPVIQRGQQGEKSMAWNNAPIVAGPVHNNGESKYWKEHICELEIGCLVIHHCGGLKPYGSNKHGGHALVSIFDAISRLRLGITFFTVTSQSGGRPLANSRSG